MRVLQISVHFHPNVGGVETHLIDLVKALIKRRWEVTVLSYSPLTTKANWRIHEKEGNVEIIRVPWLANLFYRFVQYPVIEFVYLVPGLFLVCPFIIIFKKPDVIHAHGLIAGFVGIFWGKIFRKKVIVAAHNIYHFPKKGFYKKIAHWIFDSADKSLGLSQMAVNEIQSVGVCRQKVNKFTYWIDLKLFKNVANAKERLGFKEETVVLFAGRLVKEKGVDILLESFLNWNNRIKLIIAGDGPLRSSVNQCVGKFPNLLAINIIDQKKLPLYYSAADLTIVPSASDEGFGRVIIESLACGTPVVGARRGGISEAMDESVGRLIKITPDNIKNAVEYLLSHKSELRKLSLNCRKFAERRYHEKNAERIIKAYTS